MLNLTQAERTARTIKCGKLIAEIAATTGESFDDILERAWELRLANAGVDAHDALTKLLADAESDDAEESDELSEDEWEAEQREQNALYFRSRGV